MLQKWLDIIQADLGCFKDLDRTYVRMKPAYDQGLLHIREYDGGKGVVACFVMENWFGELACTELVIYLRPEHRGKGYSPAMVAMIEDIAKENCCKTVQLGATIGYEDERVLDNYKKLGYRTVGVIKDVHRS